MDELNIKIGDSGPQLDELNRKVDEARRRQLVMARFDYLFRAAWFSIAQERGYVHDVFMDTASYGTMAIRSYNFAKGM